MYFSDSTILWVEWEKTKNKKEQNSERGPLIGKQDREREREGTENIF